MRRFTLLVYFWMLVYGSLSGQALSDSGFTDKKEAKNLTINGLKEGKWIEFPYAVKPPPAYTMPYPRFHYRYRNNYPLPVPPIDSSYTLTIYHDDIPIGTVRVYYASGILREISKYSNGLKNGIEKQFYSNGPLNGGLYYINGKEEGVEKYYYDDGKLSGTLPYTNGMLEGVRKDYYESGSLKDETPFTHDRANGVSKNYYESGALKYVIIYVNGNVESTTNYDENGNKIR